MRPSVFVVLVSTALWCWAAQLTAFENPLTENDIRNAYFLATGDASKRDAFLAQYTQRFANPAQGPAIASVEIATPLVSAIEDIALDSPNDREPDVQQKFFGKPADFRIQVITYFTPTWPSPDTTASELNRFWNDFQIHFSQDGAEISPRSVRGTPIYDSQTTSGYIGATIVAHYDPRKIKSRPATVTVDGPANARVRADFDLAALR